MHVWWGSAIWPACVFLSTDATHARGPRPPGAGHARQIRPTLVWDSLSNCHWWVGWFSDFSKLQFKRFSVHTLFSYSFDLPATTVTGPPEMRSRSASASPWTLWKITWERWCHKTSPSLTKRKTNSPLRYHLFGIGVIVISVWIEHKSASLFFSAGSKSGEKPDLLRFL